MANHLIIEANYDEEMLKFGTYPAFLKERVASPTGHLSNREAAECLAANYDPVSYTHLDVYKRQSLNSLKAFTNSSNGRKWRISTNSKETKQDNNQSITVSS